MTKFVSVITQNLWCSISQILGYGRFQPLTENHFKIFGFWFQNWVSNLICLMDQTCPVFMTTVGTISCSLLSNIFCLHDMVWHGSTLLWSTLLQFCKFLHDFRLIGTGCTAVDMPKDGIALPCPAHLIASHSITPYPLLMMHHMTSVFTVLCISLHDASFDLMHHITSRVMQ